jgi:GH15 family glucan-1,4-alpha-glucosidase
VTAFRIFREVRPSLPSGRRRGDLRRPTSVRRALAASLATAVVVSLAPVARAQTTSCYSGPAPEESGPTDISAVSGNQELTAAFNDVGTMTVFKWPSPSFYDQLDYQTTDRSAPRMGAAANDGAFLGLAWRKQKGAGWHFSWLRTWRTQQRFADNDSDEIVTKHVKAKIGLEVQVRDIVTADRDVLVRSVRVERSGGSPARYVRIFSFANFNPVYSKSAAAPEDDWCMDDASDDGAAYVKGADAVVHGAAGVDESTGEASSVSLVMAFDAASDGHQVGIDPGDSAYGDSIDAELSGNATTSSASDAAIFDSLSLKDRRRATTDVIFAAARSRKKALQALGAARSQGASKARKAKAAWWRNWLRTAPLPKGAPDSVVKLAKRSLITLRQAIDKDGLIVTSIATQSPLGLDWVRNGAYMNAALSQARHFKELKRHNLAYARHQAKLEASTTPRGNWPTSMYADGIPGSATPYEVDSTGFGLWTLWDAYRASRDINYLANVYEAIRRAADHLTDTCMDLATGLQCFAHEEDRTTISRTLVGAQAAWMGLDAAVEAADQAIVSFGHSPAKRNAWRDRRNRLRDAIVDTLYDDSCKCYTRNLETAGSLLWPVKLFARGSQMSDRHADIVWNAVRKRMDGTVKRGGMEARGLLGNAHAWAGRSTKIRKVKRALAWLASSRVTRSTGLLGGAWRVRNGRVEIMRSQAHAWHHAMFYLAALETYGKRPYNF